MERPDMRVTGPVLDAHDVGELTRFYQRLLGWEIEEFEPGLADLASMTPRP